MNGFGVAALIVAALRPRPMTYDPRALRRFGWMLLAQLVLFLAVTGLSRIH